MGNSMEDLAALSDGVVREALARRYCRPEWFLFHEVTLDDRRMDAFAIHAYRSHGWQFHGFEIKVSRGDWLREIKDPAKGDALFHRCDKWWVVAPDGVVRLDEVPALWGWLRYSSRGLRVMKAAPAPAKPAAVDRELLLRMLFLMEDRGRSWVSKAREEWHESERPRIENAVSDALRHQESMRGLREQDVERLRNRIARFEAESGVRIDDYDDGTIADAVRVVRHLRMPGHGWALRQITEDAARVKRAADELGAAMEALARSATPAPPGAGGQEESPDHA